MCSLTTLEVDYPAGSCVDEGTGEPPPLLARSRLPRWWRRSGAALRRSRARQATPDRAPVAEAPGPAEQPAREERARAGPAPAMVARARRAAPEALARRTREARAARRLT